MKALKNTLFLLAIALLCSYCGDNDSDTIDPCDASDYDERIPALISNLSTAIQNYGTDQSDANCRTVNTELTNYLNFLNEFDDCPFSVGNGDGVQEAIRETEMLIEELPCT